MFKTIKSEEAIKSVVEGDKHFYGVYFDPNGVEEKIETKEILDIIAFKKENGSQFPILFIDNAQQDFSVVVDTNFHPM